MVHIVDLFTILAPDVLSKTRSRVFNSHTHKIVCFSRLFENNADQKYWLRVNSRGCINLFVLIPCVSIRLQLMNLPRWWIELGVDFVTCIMMKSAIEVARRLEKIKKKIKSRLGKDFMENSFYIRLSCLMTGFITNFSSWLARMTRVQIAGEGNWHVTIAIIIPEIGTPVPLQLGAYPAKSTGWQSGTRYT